jgi:hypothetical protein
MAKQKPKKMPMKKEEMVKQMKEEKMPFLKKKKK